MILPDTVEKLAQQLRQRRDAKNPPVLFLGNNVALAAGAPSVIDLAKAVLPKSRQDELGPDEDKLLQAFYDYLEDMSNITRRSMLLRFYSRIPMPSFFRDIANLISGRYFQRVVTTNADTLLERALNDVGMRSGYDYAVVIPGMMTSAQSSYQPVIETKAAVRILKLHGDIAQSNVAITPEEINELLSPEQRAMKHQLAGDIVIVGYDFESGPVNQWLGWTSGELWWVHPEHPQSQEILSISHAHHIEYIEGDSADPVRFFGLLNLLLAQADISGQPPPQPSPPPPPPIDIPSFDVITSRGGGSTIPDEQAIKGSVKEAVVEIDKNQELERQYLLQNLAQSKDRLSRLEQQSQMTSERNVQLETQIEYERRQIAQIEDQLRALTCEGEQVVKLVNEVAKAIRLVNNNPGAALFMRRQVDTLKAEYNREQPSQDVIGAVIGATVLLAERLGPSVVEPEMVRRLAFIAPSKVRSAL